MLAFDAALGRPWAIQEHALDELLSIAARQNEVTPEALEAYRAQAVARGEGLQKRGSVGILRVNGPMFRYANLFTELSGATSYEILRRDLQVAQDDRDIRAILMEVDSPGGDANGVGELAKAIHASEKPVVAYVGGTAASAAYWLASAASEIVLDDAAAVGSIGVILGLTDRSKQDETRGVRRWQFVSSQSPMKRGDPASEDGATEYQRIADEMADVFIASVARYRDTDTEAVESDFGRGGLLIGANAVAAGMADEIGTFEDVLARLSGGDVAPWSSSTSRRRAAASTAEEASTERTPTMSTKTEQKKPEAAPEKPEASGDTAAKPEATEAPAPAPAQPAEPAAPAAPSASDERTRISAILNHPEAKGREELAKSLAFESDMSAEQAGKHLAAAPKAGASKSLSERMDAEATELEAPAPEGKPDSGGIAARARQRHQK